MPGSAKIVKLQVCSSLWANLCFEVGGIIGESNVTLGQSVTQFDFTTLYGQLGVATEIVLQQERVQSGLAGHNVATGITFDVPVSKPANLYDSADIYGAVNLPAAPGGPPPELMALRAESIKALLDKACALRANAFYVRYANQDAIIAKMQANYSPPPAVGNPSPTSKAGYLQTLQSLASAQYTALSKAYNTDPIRKNQGVVQSTTSTLQSATLPGSTTSTSYNEDGTKTGHQKYTTSGTDVPGNQLPPQPSGFNFPNLPDDPDAALQAQSMTYTDYGYRIPSIECNAQNVRAQVSLMDEQFAVFMAGQYVSNLGSVFPNELLAMDMDVKRLQVAYLNTILMSPITGIVTGVYKNVGDRVLPGETVIRVESTSSVYLVGVLIYRGMISLQANVSIQTTLFSSSSTPVTITGTVVAARGDQSGDDRWEVVFLCPNGTSGNPTLPLNYYFDYDEITSITFS
jgi:hypothetical protein